MQLPESSSKQWLEKDDLFESQSHVDIMNRGTCEHHTWTAPKPKWEPPRSLSRDPQCWMSPCWESVLARVRCPRLTTRSACCPCPLRAPGVAADHRAPSGWQCHTAPSACTEGAPGQRRLWKGNAGDSETESDGLLHSSQVPTSRHSHGACVGVTCSGQKGQECVGSRGSRCRAYTCRSRRSACFGFTKSGSKALPFPRLAAFQQV